MPREAQAKPNPRFHNCLRNVLMIVQKNCNICMVCEIIAQEKNLHNMAMSAGRNLSSPPSLLSSKNPCCGDE
jgi:hypothetical protein